MQVLVYRSEVVESAHRVHGAVVDGEGRLLAAVGDADLVTFARSAAKPLQAAAVVGAGAADAFGFTEAELALACASHAGQERHVEGVAAILARLGFAAADLECGLQPGRPTPLHHNCSGKHAAMLALARHRGWSTAGYTAAAHPVQRELIGAVAAAVGLPVEDVRLGVDGCSVPTFALPLRRLALGFARLAADTGPLGRVRAAMAARPDMVAGDGLFDTELCRVTGGRVVGKSGAEGVFAASVMVGGGTGGPTRRGGAPGGPGRRGEGPAGAAASLVGGWGLALKVEDGAGRAVAPAAVALLRRLGFLAEEEAGALAPLASPLVYNHRGQAVGRVEAVWIGG